MQILRAFLNMAPPSPVLHVISFRNLSSLNLWSTSTQRFKTLRPSWSVGNSPFCTVICKVPHKSWVIIGLILLVSLCKEHNLSLMLSNFWKQLFYIFVHFSIWLWWDNKSGLSSLHYDWSRHYSNWRPMDEKAAQVILSLMVDIYMKAWI